MNKLNLILRYRKVRRTTLIAVGAAGFLAGLGLVQAGVRLDGWVWCAVAAGLLALCARKRAVAVPAVLIAGLLLGGWRGTDIQRQIAVYQPYLGQKVQIVGVVVDDSVYGDKRQHDFRLTNVEINGRGPPGQVRVTSFAVVGPRRGDIVRATGKLYEGFGSYQAALYFADISVTGVQPGPVEQLRRQFAAAIYTTVPEPQASLGLGFLLGLKSQLPDTLDEQLQVLALTHIVVASGYNLTILVRASRRLFEKRSKYQAVLAASTLMAGFVAVTGFSPSMSRAALVSGLAVAAWYWGRRIHPVVLLLFAAAVTAGINPIFLWSDLGWWLSFLAFTGVLVVAPLLQSRIFGRRRPKFVGQVVLETCAAQLLTLPLTLAIFGDLPVLSLLANVLVVPLIPIAMLLTFVAGVASLIVAPIAAYIALPAVWLLTYITQIVQVLAGISWAAVPLTITMPAMLGAYGSLLVLGVVLWRKTRHDFLARSVVE